mgnify:CR=1 FL=1
MNLSLELMLQLTIILPLVMTLVIVAVGHRPNVREGVTIATSLVLLYLVINLYQGLTSGETIEVFWWELLLALQVSFTIEPLGMLFALIASFLWLACCQHFPNIGRNRRYLREVNMKIIVKLNNARSACSARNPAMVACQKFSLGKFCS